MEMRAACEKYEWDESDLAFYVKHGVIGCVEACGVEIADGDLDKICLIRLFLQIGFEKERIVEFFSQKNKNFQVRILQKNRDKLLDNIHEKQKLLDKIDYILYQIRKGER